VLDDPWDTIVEFVGSHDWIMVPDEHGVLFVMVVKRALSRWIEDIKRTITSANAGWSQVVEGASGAVECIGFMAKFGETLGKS